MRRELGMLVALILMCAGLWWSNPDFLGHSNAINTTRQISMLAIYAIGIGFVIITGGIDLSIGSVIGLTGVLIARISTGPEAPADVRAGLALALGLAAVLAVGLAVGGRNLSAGAVVVFAYALLALAVLTFALAKYPGLVGAGRAGILVRMGVVTVAAVLVALGTVWRSKDLFTTGAWAALLFQLYNMLSLALGGGHSLWLAIPVAMLVALLIGLAQGTLITRLNLQPFIVTLGGMLLIRGVSQTVVQGGTLSLGNSPLLNLANGGLFPYRGDPLLPYPLLILLLVVAVATYVLHFTVFGRYVYAIGGNRDAAEYSGINVKRVETLTYVISAGLGGVAGVCYAAYIGQMSQQVGIAYELYAIAAAVLGGCSLRGGEGTVLGIIIGSAIMRVIDNGINMFQWLYTDANGIRRIWRLDPNWTFIIIGAVILVAVILDQVVHIVQAARRTRKAGAAAAGGAAPGGFEVVPPPPAKVG
jgi:ribose transport system permease protein